MNFSSGNPSIVIFLNSSILQMLEALNSTIDFRSKFWRQSFFFISIFLSNLTVSVIAFLSFQNLIEIFRDVLKSLDDTKLGYFGSDLHFMNMFPGTNIFCTEFIKISKIF